MMLAEGADVAVHDPYVEEYPGVDIKQELDAVLDGADAVVIFTAHRQYQSLDAGELSGTVSKPHPVIVDGRNVVDPDRFIGEGWIYKGIGRGDRNSHTIIEKR